MQVEKQKKLVESVQVCSILFSRQLKERLWASHGHEGAALLVFGLPPGCSLIVLKVGMCAPRFVHFLLLSICTAILDVHFENTLPIIWFFFNITLKGARDTFSISAKCCCYLYLLPKNV